MEVQIHACLLEEMDSKMQRKPVEFRVQNDCWECISHSVSPKRKYPRAERNGKKDYLHRHVYSRFNGPIPKGMVVRHKCDNVLCINPEHLQLGTQSDNMRDMTERNRRVHGEGHANSKLTDEMARDIKYSKETGKAMAAKYGISTSVVSVIRNNKAWKHI